MKFHKIGVGSKNGDGIVQPGKRDYQYRSKYGDSKLDLLRTQPMRTLWGIMRELGPTDRILDVVKIDREGPRKAYEPAVIRNLLEDGTYVYVFYNNKLKPQGIYLVVYDNWCLSYTFLVR